jgi:hypothetical protein
MIREPTAEELARDLAADYESLGSRTWWEVRVAEVAIVRALAAENLARQLAVKVATAQCEAAELKRQLESAMSRIGQQSHLITTLTEQAKARPMGKPKRRRR